MWDDLASLDGWPAKHAKGTLPTPPPREEASHPMADSTKGEGAVGPCPGPFPARRGCPRPRTLNQELAARNPQLRSQPLYLRQMSLISLENLSPRAATAERRGLLPDRL